jgi:predicted nucleic acid-binding protein
VKVFVDSNIPMYVPGREHPHREPSRRPDLAREVYDLFVQICPVFLSVTLAETDRARDLLAEVDGISARDAIQAAIMFNHDVEWIASFDVGFDRVPGIRRLKLK